MEALGMKPNGEIDMEDFILPDPAKYNSLQSEALMRDAFAIIKKWINDPNTEIHLDNTSEATRTKVDEIMSVVAKRSVRLTKAIE